MPITTSPPRAQSLVVISLFRSSRTDASCSGDMLASTLLGADNNRVRLPLSMPQNQCRYTWCLCLQASPSKRRVTLHRIGSITQRKYS